jgi:hypothetical protein
MRQNRMWRWAVAVLAIVAGADLMAAPKPPPVPVDTGTIYYRALNFEVWSMKPDGTNKTKLAVKGTPSQALHGGERWFLTVEPVEGTCPDDESCHELFATNQAGDIPMQLTDSAWTDGDGDSYLVEFDNVNGSFEFQVSSWMTMWAADGGAADGKASFPGWTWDVTDPDHPVVVDWGIYVVTLDADDWAAIEAGASDWVPKIPVLLDDVRLIDGEELPLAEGERPYSMNVRYDWSPDGAKIVWAKYPEETSTPDLFVGTPGAGDAAKLVTNGTLPSWSLAGKIAYVSVGPGIWKIMTVDPSTGATATLVTQTNKNWTSNKRVTSPRWSPNATHLIYLYMDFSDASKPYIYDLFRVTSSGSGATNLTADQTTTLCDLIWRP